MFVEERQSAIMEELHANGKVKVKELSERFSVSEDLIRKDLSAFCLLYTSYSKLMHGLKLANVTINRKMLSEIAIHDPKGFTKIVETAKAAIEKA